MSACTAISGACTNWVWSTGCRLNFATGTPVPVLGTLNNAPETAAQVSDASGSLAFYTDGSRVWRNNNTLMPNGTGLIGGNSSHAGALVLPVPGSSTKYYIFQVREFEDGEQNDPLHYSVVDMNINDVVLAQKNINIPLPGTPRRLIEGETLIPHCNGTDWWLITHGGDAVNSNNDWDKYIYVTLITAAGAGPIAGIHHWHRRSRRSVLAVGRAHRVEGRLQAGRRASQVTGHRRIQLQSRHRHTDAAGQHGQHRRQP